MTRLRTLLLTLSAALCGAAQAQIYDITLLHSNPASLPAEARIQYENAVAALDVVDTIGAVDHLGRAAELAPDNVELQIHYVSLAREVVRLDNFGLERALEVGNNAVEAYGRILTDPDLPAWANDMAARELGRLFELLGSVDMILQERAQVSDTVIREQAALEAAIAAAQARFSAQRRARGRTDQRVGETGLLPDSDVSETRNRASSDNVQADPRLPSGNVGP